MTVESIRSGDGTINLLLEGKVYTISREHPTYAEVSKLLKDRCNTVTEAEMARVLDVKETVKYLSDGKVRVDLDAGKVFYDEVEFPDKGLCDRILKLMGEGHDFQYVINFLNRLGKNPSFRAIMQLFTFICKEGFPITPDGHILAYKGVGTDWLDKHSHTISNHVGAEVWMPREKVCDDPKQGCAPGLHAGTNGYAVSWAGDGHVVLVKIDPADVVSIPLDSSCEKLRCCHYWVVADHTNKSLLTGSVYTTDGRKVQAVYIAQFDNPSSDHWDNPTGDVEARDDWYDDDDDDDDWEDCDEDGCPECGSGLDDNGVCDDCGYPDNDA